MDHFLNKRQRMNRLSQSIQNLEVTWSQIKRNRTKEQPKVLASSKNRICIVPKVTDECAKKQKIKVVLTPKKRPQKEAQPVHHSGLLQKKFDSIFSHKPIPSQIKITPRGNLTGRSLYQSNRKIGTSGQMCHKQYLEIQDIIKRNMNLSHL